MSSSGFLAGESDHGHIKCTCGSAFFLRSYRVGGWWKQLVEFDAETKGAEVVDTNLDSLRMRIEPKTMCCAQCGKRQPNPSYDDE